MQYIKTGKADLLSRIPRIPQRAAGLKLRLSTVGDNNIRAAGGCDARDARKRQT